MSGTFGARHQNPAWHVVRVKPEPRTGGVGRQRAYNEQNKKSGKYRFAYHFSPSMLRSALPHSAQPLIAGAQSRIIFMSCCAGSRLIV